ncbi:MAG: hypothetical protein C0505_14775 [Leptothrix sp. (in: Bacteria)]|nr:hypothetical protein [Leptothrix sp. (in: b-proteobacteria)]
MSAAAMRQEGSAERRAMRQLHLLLGAITVGMLAIVLTYFAQDRTLQAREDELHRLHLRARMLAGTIETAHAAVRLGPGRDPAPNMSATERGAFVAASVLEFNHMAGASDELIALLTGEGPERFGRAIDRLKRARAQLGALREDFRDDDFGFVLALGARELYIGIVAQQARRTHRGLAHDLEHRLGAQREALRSGITLLALLVLGTLALLARHSLRSIRASWERTRQAHEALLGQEQRLLEAQRIARVGNWELDLVSHHLDWSAEIFRLFELDPARFGASYEAFLDAIHPDDRAAVKAAYSGSLRDRRPYRIKYRLRMADGGVKHVEDQCETAFAPDGTPLYSRGTVQDVTERVLAEERIRQSLLEKETLLREIHHRVKNNLQVVASLLHFHAKKLRDAASVEVFADVRAQLRSMTLVHERLYRSSDLAHIDFGDYLRALVPEIVNARAAKSAAVVTVEAADAWLPIETATPCGLLVSELLTNALKHGFPDGRRGRVEVTSRIDAGALTFSVADDGVGLPEGFDPAGTGTFGWQLIQGLATQVGGTLDVARERGTVVRVVVPLASEVPSS